MKIESHQILSQFLMGQISQEEAENRFMQLSLEQRRRTRTVSVALGLSLVALVIVKFHWDEYIGIACTSAIQFLVSLPIFHDLHTFFNRVLGELL
jgi:hypothetical protein